jgi:hypothetical protein
MSNLASKRILVGPVVVSFPKLFEKGNLNRYEVDFFFEKDDDTYKKIKSIEQEAVDARWDGVTPKKLISAIKNGDDKTNNDDEIFDGYEGKLYAKAHTKIAPAVTDKNNRPIEDPMEIKGGDVCVLLVHAFSYDNGPHKDRNNDKGIILTLDGVRKIKDGEPLGGSGGSMDYDTAADEMSSYKAPKKDDATEF